MKQTTPNEYQIVWVTAPDQETAGRLARGAVEHRLAACGKVLSQVESYYWWDEKLESAKEYQLILKTHQDRLQSLQDWITRNHPYDVPEFVVTPITGGSTAYQEWIRTETRSTGFDG